jgi:hypothetical protein
MSRTRLEPATPVTKRPQTYALDSAATEIGNFPFPFVLILVVDKLSQHNTLVNQLMVVTNFHVTM